MIVVTVAWVFENVESVVARVVLLRRELLRVLLLILLLDCGIILIILWYILSLRSL